MASTTSKRSGGMRRKKGSRTRKPLTRHRKVIKAHGNFKENELRVDPDEYTGPLDKNGDPVPIDNEVKRAVKEYDRQLVNALDEWVHEMAAMIEAMEKSNTK